MTKEFWKNWKRKNKLELDAIKVIKKGKKLILDNISKDNILAIYLKGSFVRREMNKYSDVDFVIILKNNKYLNKIKKLRDKRTEFSPDLCLSYYSLQELKNNKKLEKTKGPSSSPDMFTRNIKNHKLIYGKEINSKGFKQKTDKEKLKGLIGAFKKHFFPLYKKNQFGFSMLVKETFWLVELELKIKGKRVPKTWKGIAKSIKDKNHIVHDTIKHRLKKNKDKKLRAEYIKKLKDYLKELDKLTKK